MNNSHFQRLEKLVAKELSNKYKELYKLKDNIKHYWDKSEPDSNAPKPGLYFSLLNLYKDDRRALVESIKKLEETQREIRKILRK